jgi:hypothetical protein
MTRDVVDTVHPPFSISHSTYTGFGLLFGLGNESYTMLLAPNGIVSDKSSLNLFSTTYTAECGSYHLFHRCGNRAWIILYSLLYAWVLCKMVTACNDDSIVNSRLIETALCWWFLPVTKAKYCSTAETHLVTVETADPSTRIYTDNICVQIATVLAFRSTFN